LDSYPLQIKTSAESGGSGSTTVEFKNGDNDQIATLEIDFDKSDGKPQFQIEDCGKDWSTFDDDLPDGDEMTWTIKKRPTYIVILCDGAEVKRQIHIFTFLKIQ